jgi:pilus assembly protein FimV
VSKEEVEQRLTQDRRISGSVARRARAHPGIPRAQATLALAISAALPLALVAPAAYALGLGPAQVRSPLGEPLHVQIPVNAASVDDVGCVTVTTSNDLPGPSGLKNKVTTSIGGAVIIDITSAAPVSDPAIAFTVSAGCAAAISRSYVLLLDPPSNVVQLPSVGAPLPQVSQSAIAPAASPRGARHRAQAPGPDGATTAGASTPRPAPATAPARRHRIRTPAPIALQKATEDTGSGDRFHLSSDLGTDLRLAEELGTPDVQPIDAQQLQQLKEERLRLTAILQGQDPDAVPSGREQDLQKRVTSLNADVTALRQQLAQQTEIAKQLQQNPVSSFLTWIFGAIALVALAIAAWFGWRYRRVQQEHADQPWWEQSQLAHVTERDAGTPVSQQEAARGANTIVTAVAAAEPEVLDHDTFVRTTRIGVKPEAPTPEELAAPLADSRPEELVGGPNTVPAPVASAPVAPVVPLVSPLNPPPIAPSTYGESKSNRGTLDERVDAGLPSALDFNLDLPPVTTNLGHDDKGVAASNEPRPTELAPIDFELPIAKTASAAPAPAMGPDTILRMDEPAAADVPAAAIVSERDQEAEQASVQFRLIQFASVVEQAEELQRNHEPTKSIAILRQYVLRDETIPTLMWLMLFALYREVNKRPVYDALGEHFARRYKRPMARWDEPLQSLAPQTPLASLTELNAAIRANWGTQAGIEMVRALTCGRDQPNEVIFNAVLQRDLLQMAKVFPLSDTVTQF